MTFHRVFRLGLACFAAALCCAVAPALSAQTKVACLGEASTHSAHRTNDPEYPELMGQHLDTNFKKDASPANPLSGGMLYGGGTNYRIGNFGQPRGTVLQVTTGDTMTTFGSEQLTMAEEFAPAAVVLGPYGAHESYAGPSIPDNFSKDLQKLAARVVAFPSKPTVFLAIPIPRWGEDGDSTRRSIREWTVQVAKDMNLPTLDLWTEFLGKRSEFEDQNHLTLAGRQRMGRFIGEALKSWKAGGGGPIAAGGAGGAASGGGAAVGGGAGNSSGGASQGGAGASSAGASAIGGGSPSGGTSTGAGGSAASGGAPSAGGAPGATSGGTTSSSGSGAGSTSGGTGSGVAGAMNPQPAGGGSPSAGSSADSGADDAGCSLSPSRPDASGALGALFAVSLLALSVRRRRAPSTQCARELR